MNCEMLLGNEKILNDDEIYEIIGELKDSRVIDISGATIYSGKHDKYGAVRLFVGTSAQAFMLYSASHPE